MARLIPETNETVQETANVNLPKVERDGGTSGIAFAIVFHDAMDEIDTLLASFNPAVITALQTDVSNLQTDLGNLTTQVGTNTTNIGTNATNIGTNSTNIGTNATDITTLQNTKDDVAALPTTSSSTYDVDGNLTFYEDALVTLNNFNYDVDGTLLNYDQTVNGVTTTVTPTYDVDGNVTDQAVV